MCGALVGIVVLIPVGRGDFCLLYRAQTTSVPHLAPYISA